MPELAQPLAVSALLSALLSAVGVGLLARAPRRAAPLAAQPPPTGRRQRRAWWVAGGVLAAAIALWWGGPVGVVVGAAVAPATALVGSRATSRGGPTTPIAAGQPALAADLLVATVGAGVPLSVATDAVASSMTGPFAGRLRDVARRASAGAAPATAHEPLLADRATASIGRALVRAHDSGASPVPLLAGAASRERERERSQRVGRARSAGSLAALPLGLLFLPAFVLVAVVPVVVGALGPVLAS